MELINKNWSESLDDLYNIYQTSSNGLTSNEIKIRLKKYGFNEIKKNNKLNVIQIFIKQFKSPLIVILIVACILAFFLNDFIESIIILIIVIVNSFLSFFQEYKAEKTFQILNKLITFKSKVLRDNKIVEISSKEIVPGDIVILEMGNIVPADLRLIESKNLSVDESIITGESIPVEKVSKKEKLINQTNPIYMNHMVFMSSSVVSGKGIGLVISTAKETYIGQISKYLEKKDIPTNFQKSIQQFSKMLIKVTLALTLFIFIINFFLLKNIFYSLLFALALAIGITPELLPVIITITLSYGAQNMAKKKVIVKTLSSIENLGNMDTLCCDKTGTLTEGIFSLEKYLDFNDQEIEKILIYSFLCNKSKSEIQEENKFVTNPMDKAILNKIEEKKIYSKLQEYNVLDNIDFDFSLRRLTCIVSHENKNIIVSKGSPDSILKISNSVLINDKIVPLNSKIDEINKKIENFENNGYRIILVAIKETDENKIIESNLILVGYLIFIDQTKKTAKESLDIINNLGVNIKIITGDSPLITKKICNDLNIKIVDDKIILGKDLENLSTKEFEQYINKFNIFARITPDQKYNIVKTLNFNGHIVGFLGDGVNDAPALKAADIGISVESGTDITKNIADIILLQKSLNVLSDGIIEGRKAFGNTIKYIFNTISSNFGNMLTVALSSLFLPFIPLIPSQILLINLITDMPLAAIATDNLDKDFLIKPRKWNINLIKNFMLFFGSISAFYDFCLIFPLRYFFQVNKSEFRTSWFLLSIFTEICITFFIRTKKFFVKSKPSNLLISTSLLMFFLALFLPFSTFGNKFFKLVPISNEILIFIFFILILYCFTVELTKKYFFKKF